MGIEVATSADCQQITCSAENSKRGQRFVATALMRFLSAFGRVSGAVFSNLQLGSTGVDFNAKAKARQICEK